MTPDPSTEAQEFLEWLAGWLDRIPILRAVFAKADLTDDEHQQIDEWLKGTEVQSRLRALAARFSQADTELSIAAQQQESTNSYVAELEARLSQAEELAAGYKAERDAARKMASLGHTAAQLREATGHLEKVTAFVVQNRIQGALWDAAYAAREWLAASSAGETGDA